MSDSKFSHSSQPLSSPKKTGALPRVFSRLIPAIAAGLIFWIGFVILTEKPDPEPDISNLNSWQESDTPFGIPIDLSQPEITQQFDHRFNFFSPWEKAAIPRTESFQAAMGSETGAFTYNAQPFDTANPARGGNHSGDDINGIGGENSDLGDPVYAAANGLVVYLGEPTPGWGSCIVLAHRTPDGKIVQSMYAHLLSSTVYYMQQVPRGYKIGEVGNAGKRYLAHLHLEMREADGVSPFLNGYPSLYQHDRLNPSATIANYQAPDASQLAPSVLKIVQKNFRLPELEMDQTSMMNYLKYQNRMKEKGKPDKSTPSAE